MSFFNQSLGIMFLSFAFLKSAFIVLKDWEENCSFRGQSLWILLFPWQSNTQQVLLLLFSLVKLLHTAGFYIPSAKSREAPGVTLPFTVLFAAISTTFCPFFSSLVRLLITWGFYLPSTRRAIRNVSFQAKVSGWKFGKIDFCQEKSTCQRVNSDMKHIFITFSL